MTSVLRALHRSRRYPDVGACGICGRYDARHRLWESIDGRVRAGEALGDIARDYGVRRPYVMRIVEAFAEARRRHVALPGRLPL